jgi:hypothetical protein
MAGGALGLALAIAPGCRRDDTTAVGPSGGALQPMTSTSALLPQTPPASGSAAAPAPAGVVMTAFDSKEPPAFQAAVESAGCALDQVSGASAADVTEVPRGSEVRLIGWAADTTAKTVPPVVVVQLVGKQKYYAPAVHATLRPDVAESFGAPQLLGSGWDLLTTFSNVAPGTYDVRLLAVASTGDTATCDSKKKLAVK